MSNGRPRRMTASSLATVIALTMLASSASPALADGDPASDVLAVQRLFVPAGANVPAHEEVQLEAMLAEAAHKGYSLRVALIATQSDLGSVTTFWGRPQAYAQFLGSELSLVYHGTVLVVMPNGYGVDVTASGTRTASGQAQLPLPRNNLAGAALIAIQRFAAGAHTPVSAPEVRAEPGEGRSDSLPWIVFVSGFVPAALAWALSFKRRPARRPVRIRQN